VFSKVMPRTKTLPPATETSLEKLSTLIPLAGDGVAHRAGLAAIDGSEDDLRAFLDRACGHLRGLSGVARGGIDAQVEPHAGQVAHRQPRRVLEAVGEDLVALFARARGHQQRHLHGGAGVDARPEGAAAVKPIGSQAASARTRSAPRGPAAARTCQDGGQRREEQTWSSFQASCRNAG
jgi:hypothetical protein